MSLTAEQFRSVTLEAPGEFLSGLLGVSQAQVLPLRAGSIRALPAEFGVWRVAAPLHGALRVAAGDQAWPLEPRQAAVLEGREELSLLPTEDGALGLIVLRGEAADRVFDSSRREGGLFFARGGEAVERMLRLLLARAHRQVSAKEASEAAYALLMALAGTGSAGPAGQRSLPYVVEAALNTIRQDYAFLDGIGELAGRLEVSQAYLTRCFLKETGVTPGKYLNQVRIENACILLRQGTHTVQFVSDACGFANANYFARVFRQSVGLNPRAYARQTDAPQDLPDLPDRDEHLYVL
ncbi:MAG: helix-turn-helix transcriptional regulator [Oscillospiraceae bacterium]|nr:helix-turn-helix transcriptional regulator [Oscillospiraceae bacterium]